MNEFSIDCRVVPLGENDPLFLFVHSEVGVLSVSTPIPRPCPKGLNIDGLLVFDLQEDGGLDAIEVLYKLPARYRSKAKRTFPLSEKYHRILLDPSRMHVGGPEVAPILTMLEDILTISIQNGVVDGRYKIGPETVVLLMKGKLIGIEIDLSSFGLR